MREVFSDLGRGAGVAGRNDAPFLQLAKHGTVEATSHGARREGTSCKRATRAKMMAKKEEATCQLLDVFQ